jgi:two-component system, chemotaxis family, protein-glutamate methylesterase/glutaminase
MAGERIIVVGASAGGVNALLVLVSGLPADLRAAVFVTLHFFERTESILPDILADATELPVHNLSDRVPVETGHIYVAPPDYHLLLSPGWVSLGHGPKENLQRPCINVMFRSAAKAYGEDVIGVLLTGMLDDGASGLWEIQQQGGVTIVQDPEEAAYRSMPESALRGFGVDHVVRLTELGRLLTDLTRVDEMPTAKTNAPTEEISDNCRQICPECGGVMTRAAMGRLQEYRCHIGHRFGLKTMIAEKTGLVERALSTALAQTEELTDLLKEAKADVDASVAATLDSEIEARGQQARQLRDLLESRIARSLVS